MQQQQMLFARPSGSWQRPSAASDSSSPRRVVTFAAPPPSAAYRSQQSRAQSPDAADPAQELPAQPEQRQRRPRAQPNTRRDTANTNSSEATAARLRPRRPGWDTDVSHGSTLFDASLKKASLFQPRAGDRRKQQQVAEKQGAVSKGVTGSATTTSSGRRKTATTRTTPVRYRSGPSSVYQRHNVTPWPQRRAKDFVRRNIEHLTGRPVDARSGRSEARSRRRESVFERLAAPRVSKALLRSHVLSVPAGSDLSPRPVRSPSVSSLSPPRSGPAQSPVLTIDPPAPDQQDSPRSVTPSPGTRRSGLGWSSPYSSPQRSQQSFSSRQSPAPRSSSTNRSSGVGSRTQRHDSYPARVFGVLDRDNEKRIGVSQILQGLRLLGLPATHNQISDYVYLIHEGRHNSIDLEEWEILVGTLDAASRPSSHSPRSANTGQGSAVPSRSPSMRSFSEHSPYSSIPPSSSPQARSDHPSNLTSKRRDHMPVAPTRNRHASHDDDEHISTTVQREAIVSAERQHNPDDDPYLEEIQNRIEGMFERAQATAALRWAPEPGNNQFENDPDHSRSDRILKRAAIVVHSLRASLFPLVHQAEATLREIQQRHGSKLSLFLPPGDMAAIAQNSDVLASAILDDMLLDTIQVLNEEDKQQSCRQLDAHHAYQLDDILARIDEIQRAEDNMIHQGLALSYQTSGIKCDLPTASVHGGLNQSSAKPSRYDNVNLPKLTLPLEVVMSINVSDSDVDPLPHNAPGHVTDVAVGNTAFAGAEIGSFELETSTQQILFAETPVTTAILQGKRLQSIERRRHKFQHYRRLVEASLAETGMTQFAVIEILEEMLLDDLLEQTAAELNGTSLNQTTWKSARLQLNLLPSDRILVCLLLLAMTSNHIVDHIVNAVKYFAYNFLVEQCLSCQPRAHVFQKDCLVHAPLLAELPGV
ncbi:hypothetical protein PHYPSEUDO_011121 [Phytophthora pseudosyringae]|uniref:EF-hand domain-containing protein n=1 Tax=Phytophthora pseudosyringae TaxID=221518 RepID=A0A8T1VDZ2_9STRA|nr:hypothetical protein PHYPSEUDO_011121 [Phytophthora pseudosyringae]